MTSLDAKDAAGTNEDHGMLSPVKCHAYGLDWMYPEIPLDPTSKVGFAFEVPKTFQVLPAIEYDPSPEAAKLMAEAVVKSA